MLLSSEKDFNYDDRASSSNPSGPPPGGDGSSGRGYRIAITEAVTGIMGFIRGSDGPGRSDSERQNNYLRRNHNERYNDNWGRDSLRDTLRHIAVETLHVLDDGEYFPPGQDGPYDLKAKIRWTEENTRYYGPDAGDGGEISEKEFIKINEDGGDEEKEEESNKLEDGITGTGDPNEKQGENNSEKAAAASKPHDDDNLKAYPIDQTRVQATLSPDPPKKATLDNTRTTIYVGEYSTLVGARKVYLALALNTDPSVNKKIGVLNFASAKKPGGGFIGGSQAQEESLARASTLYPSLITEDARQFYTNYHEDPGNAYYTHAMVYSPGIVLIRDDDGEWRSPVEVDVLTSAAVNAGEVRRGLEREERLRRERVEMEYWKRRGEERRREVERAMAERQRQREERAEKQRQREENKKAKEGIAKLKKEQANAMKLTKEMSKVKETDKGKTKDSGSEKEEPFDDKAKAAAEVENENEENEELEGEEDSEVVEKPDKNQDNTIGSQDNGLGSSSDSQLKGAEENTESKGTLIQDDQPQLEVLPEINQEPSSSSTIIHPLSPPSQPSQAPVRDPNLTYALTQKTAEIQIEQTMYDRISRILHLFQLHQTSHLILGSFGTGVFKNRTDLIATIFADLLIKPGARFGGVFQTVVFAILGKETVRVFSEVFKRADKRAQRDRPGSKTYVFVDSFGSDGDVKEGDEEKMMRMMRWKARIRERRHSSMCDISGEAADTFDPGQIDAFDPPSFDAAQASAFSYHTSSAPVDAVDAASYTPSFDTQADADDYATSSNAFQASAATCTASSNNFQGSTADYTPSSNAAQGSVAYPPCFDATKASGIPCLTSFTATLQQVDATVQANPTAVYYHEIPEDAEMILTRDDEQLNFVAEATPNFSITPKAMVVDDGRDIETMETKSFPICSCEAQSSKSNKKEDSDIEMQ